MTAGRSKVETTAGRSKVETTAGRSKVETTAAVALLHATAPVESVLLIRRASNPRDPWSGHWSFPGGRRDPSDLDLLATALRELHEECSIALPRDAVAEALTPSLAGRAVGKFVSVAPFVFRLKQQLPIQLQEREAVSSLWLPVDRLRDRSLHTVQPVPGVPPERRFPAIDVEGTPLWGFTYRVLCEWLRVEMPQE
jgi:8-oxo-dGTP pyrophosphatase MutT (NUDIX family)